jgi:hypothetical protein
MVGRKLKTVEAISIFLVVILSYVAIFVVLFLPFMQYLLSPMLRTAFYVKLPYDLYFIPAYDFYASFQANVMGTLALFFFPLFPTILLFFVRVFWHLRKSFKIFYDAWNAFKGLIERGIREKRMEVISAPLGYASMAIVYGTILASASHIQGSSFLFYSLIYTSEYLLHIFPLINYLLVSLLCLNIIQRTAMGFIILTVIATPAFIFMVVVGLFYEKSFVNKVKNLK